MAQVIIENHQLGKYITVEVVVKKHSLFDIRLWIGIQLIKLGTRIAGFGYKENEAQR